MRCKTFLTLSLLSCIIFYILLSVHVHNKFQNYNYIHTKIGSINQLNRSNKEDIIDIIKNHGTRTNNGTSTSNNNGRKGEEKGEGLSACLLVNDENPRLPEWIAYHYHMLPLRSLTITVDPASRSSPVEILNRWHGLIDVQIWEEGDFLPMEDSRIKYGACNGSDVNTDCLLQHLRRQRYFVKKCMADFKQRNTTWVLLIDVDEYITFNPIQEDDPSLPLDYAPEGTPTLSRWKKNQYKLPNSNTGQLESDVNVEGTISGLPEGGIDGKKNGDQITTQRLVTENNKDHLLGIHGVAYGNVVEESNNGMKYYLQNNFAFRNSVPMSKPPGGVPLLEDSYINGSSLFGKIHTMFNATFRGKKDGEMVEIKTNWRESPPDANVKTIMGGHLMLGTDGFTYYVKREQALWPPQISTKESLGIRKRLPAVGDGKTIMDVLESETKIFGEYAKETIGPCLSMPRLLYGTHEDQSDPNWVNMAPEGFSDDDFVTLRYTWHAMKEANANRFQKAIIDVSRLPMGSFKGEAENIHTPLNYYCRKDPPRYSVSFFRVNHYLDSFEAYSYRNDARSSKRQCRECYDTKGKEAAASLDDGIRLWLKSFVESVGPQNAKNVLAGAGNFVRL